MLKTQIVVDRSETFTGLISSKIGWPALDGLSLEKDGK